MLSVQLYGPISNVGWIWAWPCLWRAQTLLSFLLWWVDRFGRQVWAAGASLIFIVAKDAIFPFGFAVCAGEVCSLWWDFSLEMALLHPGLKTCGVLGHGLFGAG